MDRLVDKQFNRSPKADAFGSAWLRRYASQPMLRRTLVAAWLILGFAPYCTALAIDVRQLPDQFKRSIPSELKGGLALAELESRCKDCEPSRQIDFYANNSLKPVRSERVSVVAGYRAMYAYPGADYFANVKIEQSGQGEFDRDRQVMEAAIRSEYERKRDRIETYLAQNPEVKARLELVRARGKNYMDLEQGERSGVRFISYVENAIGLTGATISQVHFFVPSSRITVTAYLLKQQVSRFRTIDEFLAFRREFIESYCDFLAGPKRSSR